MNYFVARIHNGSLGKCVAVDSWDEGTDLIREWVKSQFNRDVTDDENSGIDLEGEFTDDSDHDNSFTFTIGILEEA